MAIYSPDHLHAEHCTAAIQAGKHVICTKPMVTDLDDAKRLVELVRKKEVKFLVGQTMRFDLQFSTMRRFLEDGDLGEILASEAYYVHDMREVYKENHFDIATNLFTSFGYFENKDDEQKAINAMARNLKSNGILVIDFMNAKKVIANLISSEKKTINDITFNIKRSVQDNHIIKDIEIIIGNETQYFQEKVRAITLADFSVFFRNVGLNIIDIFGNYKLDDFDATISDRLILICKK